MRGEELFYFLTTEPRTRRIFAGVFSRDKLPKHRLRKRPLLFVVNTDHSDGPGEHWVCIYLDPFSGAEYFDSFGIPPYHREIITFLCKNSKRYVYNSVVLQGPFSQTCGHYCVYYARKKSLGHTIRQILRDFRILRPHYNDHRVISLL